MLITSPCILQGFEIEPKASFTSCQMEQILKLGPKKMKGITWDDGGKSKLMQILISYGKNTVYSIQFVYAVNGKTLPSEIHGKPCGSKFDIVSIYMHACPSLHLSFIVH